MAHNLKRLGQARPSSANTPVSLFSPAATGDEMVSHTLVICNTTATKAEYSIYEDSDGSTYDDDSVLFNDQPIGAKETIVLEIKITLNNTAGNVAVESDTANAINFVAYGEEFV